MFLIYPNKSTLYNPKSLLIYLYLHTSISDYHLLEPNLSLRLPRDFTIHFIKTPLLNNGNLHFILNPDLPSIYFQVLLYTTYTTVTI